MRFNRRFAVGDYVLFDPPPLKTTPTERIDGEGYTKLTPRRLYLYCILNVGPKYSKTSQDGVGNIMSSKRATLTRAEVIRYDTPQYSSVCSNEHENIQLGKYLEGVNNTQDVDTYVVDKIIKHSNTPEGRRYIVRWHGYTSEADTLEPEKIFQKILLTDTGNCLKEIKT